MNAPMNAPLSLADVLARPDVWRGDALAQAPLPGVPTGFAELDAELPGGGWPRGGLVELLAAQAGIGELGLLLPALARFSAAESSWVVCVAPPYPLHAPAWEAAGVALSHLLITRARGGDAAWACARVLEADGVGALLAWLPGADANALRRLQLAAEASRTLAFVFRPLARAREASPAPLRLVLEGAGGRLAVSFLKRRGGTRPQPLSLFPGRPAPLRHALASPAPAAAAARSLPQSAAA